MTDDDLALITAAKQPKPRGKGKPLAKGYDPRRWLGGRPRVPKDKAEAQKIVDSVIWEELSRVIKNPDNQEEIDALRLMIRSMIRNKNNQDKILDRILGKATQSVDLTSAGDKIELVVKYADDNKSTPPAPKTD
jgi:hypothetical protein